MEQQTTMPFLRLNDITEMAQSLGMYESLELDWRYDENAPNLVERTHDPMGVSRYPRMTKLNEEEVAYCRTLRIYDR